MGAGFDIHRDAAVDSYNEEASQGFLDKHSAGTDGWVRIDTIEGLQAPENFGFQAGVYYNKTTGQTVVGYAGTQPGDFFDAFFGGDKSGGDLLADTVLGGAGVPIQGFLALDYFDYVRAKLSELKVSDPTNYGNFDSQRMSTAGHSLGGFLAQFVGVLKGVFYQTHQGYGARDAILQYYNLRILTGTPMEVSLDDLLNTTNGINYAVHGDIVPNGGTQVGPTRFADADPDLVELSGGAKPGTDPLSIHTGYHEHLNEDAYNQTEPSTLDRLYHATAVTLRTANIGLPEKLQALGQFGSVTLELGRQLTDIAKEFLIGNEDGGLLFPETNTSITSNNGTITVTTDSAKVGEASFILYGSISESVQIIINDNTYSSTVEISYDNGVTIIKGPLEARDAFTLGINQTKEMISDTSIGTHYVIKDENGNIIDDYIELKGERATLLEGNTGGNLESIPSYQDNGSSIQINSSDNTFTIDKALFNNNLASFQNALLAKLKVEGKIDEQGRYQLTNNVWASATGFVNAGNVTPPPENAYIIIINLLSSDAANASWTETYYRASDGKVIDFRSHTNTLAFFNGRVSQVGASNAEVIAAENDYRKKVSDLANIDVTLVDGSVYTSNASPGLAAGQGTPVNYVPSIFIPPFQSKLLSPFLPNPNNEPFPEIIEYHKNDIPFTNIVELGTDNKITKILDSFIYVDWNDLSWGSLSLNFLQNPIVLDLDGDGIESFGLQESTVYFDMTGDGFRQRTGWVSGDDGQLVIDLNSNGIIDDINELFGGEQLGFSELADYDTNGDNVINSSDTQFGSLKVWQDLNVDGVTDTGELKTLSDLSIVSIDLTNIEDVYEEIGNGNVLIQRSSYTKADSTVREISDIGYEFLKTDTIFNGNYQVDIDTVGFPWLRGSGLIKDLLMEASGNDALKQKIRELAYESDARVLYAKFDDLLLSWTGVDSVDARLKRGGISERKAQLLEKLVNIPIPSNLPDHPRSAAFLESAYAQIKDKLYLDFISQTNVGKSLGLEYDFFLNDVPIDESTIYNKLINNLTDTKSSFNSFIISKVLFSVHKLDLNAVRQTANERGYGHILVDYLLGNQTSFRFRPSTTSLLRFGGSNGSTNVVDEFGRIWTAHGNAKIDNTDAWLPNEQHADLDGLGSYIKTIEADLQSNQFTLRWKQRFDSSAYSILVSGLSLYSFQLNYSEFGSGKLGFGVSSNGTVYDIANNVKSSSSFSTGTWYDIEITYSDSFGYKVYVDGNEEISISNTDRPYKSGGLIFGAWGAPGYEGSYSVNGAIADLYWTNTSVLHAENFTPNSQPFDPDGFTHLVGSDLASDIFNGTEFGDTIKGFKGNDLYLGLGGDDTIYGGAGNDTYIYNIGDGNDLIIDSECISTLVFGEGIRLNGLDFIRTVDGSTFSDDLEIRVGFTGNTITIQGYFTGPTNKIHHFAFQEDQTLGGVTKSVFSYHEIETILSHEQLSSATTNGSNGDDIIINHGDSSINADTASIDMLQETDDWRSMLRFGGTDGSTNLTDEFGNTWTAFGNASIQSTNPWTPGEKHVALDGTGDYIKTTDINPSTGAYTIRWRQRFNAFTGTQTLLSSVDDQSILLVHNGTNLKLSLSSDSLTWDIGEVEGTTTSWTTDQWYEFEFSYSEREGYRLFVNGTLEIENIDATATIDPQGLILGANSAGSNASAGAIADLYFTNSEVLHRANFTTSSDPYPLADSGNGDDQIINYGNATITGGVGNDTIISSSGNDMFVYASGFGEDEIFDVGGSDTLDFSAFTAGLAVDLNATSFVESAGNTVTWNSGAIENVIGGSGNDTLTGDADDNTLTGNDGNDSLVGGEGDDTYVIASGFGTDTISDAAGVDTLDLSGFTSAANVDISGTSFVESVGNTITWGLGEIENIVGGSGDDTLAGDGDDNTLTGNAGNDSLVGGSGDDTYLLTSGFGNDTISDTAGSDTLDARALTGNLGIDLSGTSFVESAGNTVIWGAGEIENVIGGSGNDILTGDGDDNTLAGGTGDDSLVGGAGNDIYVLENGFGLDTIADSTGTDTLDASALTNSLTIDLSGTSLVESAENTVTWGTGELENASGGSSNDQLIGTTGSNVLQGNAGADSLEGGAGDDTLEGGTGSDTYVFASGFGVDTITETSGLDALDFSAFTTGLSISLAGTSFVESAGNTVTWGADDIENLTTGSGADSLTGNSGDNVLVAGGGDDTLVGGAGDDLLQGGMGNDAYTGFTNATGADVIDDEGGVSDSADFGTHLSSEASWTLGDADLDGKIDQLTIDFGNGHSVTINDYFDNTVSVLANTAAGSGAIESLLFNSGADVVDLTDVKTLAAADSGTIGNDTMTGTNFDDSMDGLAGDDVIDALSGNDTVVGGTGNDTLTGGSGNDSLDGGADNDTYVFANGFGKDTITDASGTDKLDFSSFTGSVNIDLSKTSYAHSFGNTVTWAIDAIENLTTGSGNDTLTGNGSNNVLDGGSGDDTYVLKSGFGLDTVNDSGGSDKLDLSALTTAIDIDLSTDSSFVESVGNTLSWTLGAIENITGGSGNDTLTGDSDANTLVGGSGDDSLDGGSGNDTLWGGNGNDVLIGNSDNNQLFGENGNDTLTGGAGNDALQGGLGDDAYVLNSGFGLDTISDSGGSDTLDLGSFITGLNVALTGASFVESAGNTVTWGANEIENLTTGSGNDTLTGNSSDNKLVGGTGNDAYVGFTNASGNDTISDAGGTDSANFTGHNTTEAEWAALDTDMDGNVDALKIDFENGHSVTLENFFDDTASTAAASGAGTGAIESFIFDDDADVIFSEAQTLANADYGTPGNDSMDGTAGADIMDGLAGNDTINGLAGNDELRGNAGNDSISGGDGDDLFIEGTNTGTDTYDGGLGTDTVDYLAAVTQVKYYTNNNQVVTGGETDTLSNIETVKASSTVASDQIYGALNSAALTVDLSTNSISGGDGDVTTVQNFEDVVGSAYNDSITGDANDNWFNGQAGNDTLIGNGGADELLGASGADSLVGGAGNDTLEGGDGNDVLEGGDNDDQLTGSAGNDTLKGGLGNDTYLGFSNASGADVIDDAGGTADKISFAGSSTAAVTVEALDTDADTFVDQLKVDFGNGHSVVIEDYFDDTSVNAGTSGQGAGYIETLVFDDKNAVDFDEAIKLINRGTAGADSITGTNVADFIQANAGNDTVQGLDGDDYLDGGAGNDSLVGGADNDILIGGTGNDTLDGGAGDDIYVFAEGDGSDQVTDSGGTDTFDFTAFTEGIEIDLSSTEFGAGGSDTGKALLHFDGADDSTTISDEFGNTWTSYNSADIDSTDPWLTGEKHVDTTGSKYIASTAVDTNGDAWTLRWRQRLNDVGAWRTLVTGNGNVAFGVYVNNGYLQLHASSNNSTWNLGTDSGTTLISAGSTNWYELELTFSTSSGYKLYLDGTLEAELSSTTKMYDSNGVRFGMGWAGTDSSSGAVADVYFTNYEVFHTSNFTPLSTPWSKDGVTWAANAIENALGGQGNDTMTGNSGANALSGFAGDDSINGGAGADSLFGGLGNDTLSGNAGADQLDGGEGDDTYVFASGFGEDTISDESGSDTLDFSAFTGGLNIDLLATSFVESIGNTVTWTAGEVDNLITGSGNDTLTGNSGDNIFRAGAGNDSLSGGDGNDTYVLTTGFGLDTISDASGLNILDVSFYASNLTMDLSTATSFVESAGNTVSWTSGDIKGLYSGSGNDTLTGDGNANILSGGTGNDSLVGGAGDDTYVFAPGFGLDTVNDASGTDTFDFSAFATNLNLDLTATSFVSGAGNTVTWTSNTIEGLAGGSGNDTLTGNGSGNILSGGSGNDTLDGGAGADLLDGGEGDDNYIFNTGFGDDTLSDSGGFDTLDFSSFSTNLSINLSAASFTESVGNTLTWNTNVIEKIIGGSGNDAMTGNSAGNHLTGTILQGLGGDDTLIGGTGNDQIDGGTGDDSMTGGAGDDTYIFADGFGNDTISDTSGVDTLDFSQYTGTVSIDLGGTSFADASGNTLTWGSGEIEHVVGALTGNNHLIGDAGDNVLAGGQGNDTLEGKGGNDTYVFEDGFGIDTITNETGGIDTLDFGAVTSNLDLDLSDTSVVADAGNTVSWASNAIENIIGGSGNDTLTGNADDNLLKGGSGDDTYVVAVAGGTDSISDSGGSDTLDFSAFTDAIEVDLTTTQFGVGGTDTGQALLHFEGADDSTTITDEFGNTWTSYNSADIDSTNPWLTGEKHVDTTGSKYIASTAVDTNGDAWTLRWRQRLNDVGAWRTLVTGNGNVAFGVYVNNGYLQLHASSNNSTWNIGMDSGTTLLSAGSTNWYELELTFSTSSGYKLYLNGTLEAELTSTTKMYDSNGLRFGMGWAGTDSSSGAVADVYFTNYEVLHTGNFTPLNEPWSTDGVTWGTNEMDNIIGGSGNDTLTGNSADNKLAGGAGNDTLDGGAGNDTYIFAASFGLDSIADASGTDTLDLSALTTGLNADLSGTSFVESVGNTITWTSGILENLVTSSGNDTLTGTTGNNVLTGGAGNDSLVGGAGNDTYAFAPNFGTDTITDSAGTDTLDFNAFTTGVNVDLSGTSFSTGVGHTVTWGANEIENLTGGSGNDTLTGNSSGNTLIGGAGDDILDGKTGDDSLEGGLGNDTYKLVDGDGLDTINDAGGSADKVLFGSTLDNTEVAFYMNGDDLEIGYLGTSDKVTVLDQDAGTGKDIDRFELASGEYLTAADVAQVIQDMSTYAQANTIDFTSLSDVKNSTALMQIITDGWNAA